MVLPNLIHPVPVEIELLDRAVTIVDDDYREPVQQAVRAPRVTCPGQVHWTMDERLRSTLVGAEQEAEGYILFRLVDLRAVGINRLEQNDRYVAIGTGLNKIEVDLYVVGLRYQAHYSDQGGPTMVKGFFRDRHPSKQTRGGKQIVTPTPPPAQSLVASGIASAQAFGTPEIIEVQAASAWAGPFTSVDYLAGSAGVGHNMTPGTLLNILWFKSGNAISQPLWAFSEGTTSGWRIRHSGSVVNLTFNNTNFSAGEIPQLSQICNLLFYRRLDGSLVYSMDERDAVQISASQTYTTASGAAIHAIGRSLGTGANQQATQSNVLATLIARKVGSDFSLADLKKFTGQVNRLNRAQLHPELIADPSVLHYAPISNWDGGTTLVGSGSDPLTLTRQGTGGAKTAIPAYARRVIPQFAVADNAYWGHPGNGEPPGTNRMSSYARAVFTSNAQDVSGVPGLVVEGVMSAFGAIDQHDIGVFVNGVAPTASGEAAVEFNEIYNILRAMDCGGIGAGAGKTFEIVNGNQRWPGTYGLAEPVEGMWPVAVRVPLGSTFDWVTPVAPANRIVVLSDGHATEIEDSANNITSVFAQAWPQIMRVNASPRGVATDAWNSHSLFAMVGDSTKRSIRLGVVQTLANGTVTNKLVIDAGVTDYNHNLYSNLAQLESDLGTFCDQVTAAIPGIQIFIINSTPAAFGTGPNAQGWTMTQLRTSLGNVAATRGPNVVYHEAGGFVTGGGIGVSGVYSTVLGMQQCEAGVRAMLGY